MGIGVAPNCCERSAHGTIFSGTNDIRLCKAKYHEGVGVDVFVPEYLWRKTLATTPDVWVCTDSRNERVLNFRRRVNTSIFPSDLYAYDWYDGTVVALLASTTNNGNTRLLRVSGEGDVIFWAEEYSNFPTDYGWKLYKSALNGSGVTLLKTFSVSYADTTPETVTFLGRCAYDHARRRLYHPRVRNTVTAPGETTLNVELAYYDTDSGAETILVSIAALNGSDVGLGTRYLPQGFSKGCEVIRETGEIVFSMPPFKDSLNSLPTINEKLYLATYAGSLSTLFTKFSNPNISTIQDIQVRQDTTASENREIYINSPYWAGDNHQWNDVYYHTVTLSGSVSTERIVSGNSLQGRLFRGFDGVYPGQIGYC